VTIVELDPAALWLAGALVLGIAELLVPGVFLIFLAIAAAVTALTTWALPHLPVGLQLADFAVWSVVCVMIGRRWYRDFPVESDAPVLNEPARRLRGQRGWGTANGRCADLIRTSERGCVSRMSMAGRCWSSRSSPRPDPAGQPRCCASTS
jgi:membrane protein implicated in regulation of membrane protease activity